MAKHTAAKKTEFERRGFSTETMGAHTIVFTRPISPDVMRSIVRITTKTKEVKETEEQAEAQADV